MALKSTIYKAHINVADTDRGYYADHALTLACHPSETEERLMVRLLAFALFASENLQLCRGISSDDEPDIEEKSLTGEILRWIELGTPDDSRIRKACNRSREVVIITFGGRGASTWWEKIRGALERFDNLTVMHIPREACEVLVRMVDRSIGLQITIQDGVAFVSGTAGGTGINVEIAPEFWQRAKVL